MNYNLVLINQLKNETLIRAGFNVSDIINSDILALLFKDYLTSNKKSLEISHHIITDKKFVYIPESFLLNTFFNCYNFYSREENHLKFIEFLSVYLDLFLDNNSEFDNLFSDNNLIIGNLFSNGNWEIIKLLFDNFFEMEDNLYYKMLIDKIVFEIKANYTFSNYTDSNQRNFDALSNDWVRKLIQEKLPDLFIPILESNPLTEKFAMDYKISEF